MDKFKDFLRSNKKLVAAIIVAVMGLLGVAIAPDTADKIADGVVQVVAPAPAAKAP